MHFHASETTDAKSNADYFLSQEELGYWSQYWMGAVTCTT